MPTRKKSLRSAPVTVATSADRATKTVAFPSTDEAPGLRPDLKPATPPSQFDQASPIDRRDERSNLQLYLNVIRQTALLTVEEEIKLAARIKKGDKAARDHMITANLRLVVKIAYDYHMMGLPLMDLISEGNLGLIKAVERFDPAKGGKLSTYAAWWIKQSMKRALANQSKTIRLPVHAPVGEDHDSATLGDLVGDDNAISPYDGLGDKNLKEGLHAMVNSLDPREASILKLRFGLGGEKEMTLEEVGKKFKVTRERIRQLEYLALGKIRRQLQKQDKQLTTDEIEQERHASERAQTIRDYVATHSGATA